MSDGREALTSYEQIQDKLSSNLSDAYRGVGGQLIRESLLEIDQVYEKVQADKKQRKHNEVLLKDAEAFRDASNFAAINFKNVKHGDVGLTLTRNEFLKQLKKYLVIDEGDLDIDDEEDIDNGNAGVSNDDADYNEDHSSRITSSNTFYEYNWLKLGALYLSVSDKSILCDSLNGPLETEKKAPITRTRHANDINRGTLTTALTIDPQEIIKDDQTTYDIVKSVYSDFTSDADNEEGKTMNFFKFFINPNSFLQSIENLFYVSFLIKEGRLNLLKDDKGVPVVRLVSEEERLRTVEDDNTTAGDYVHHIASMDYDTWRKLIEKFNITESFIEERG
ncbi:nuclear protein [Scheffersomyces spartinae]|uniref:Non-structural maintenance of chromosomes element 4 n=1 Tax=Scheffersomyces spartinae TaxID=45513 RepID=A0A9P8AJ10_9ASCO|nr:nuclear protein [Scheffersomyces spartinae]KAG7194296.1 nuclear protein [Scheffersomyces spartinae]